MFEFGKDLRRLFTQARESDDLGWVELIGADLLEREARRQTTDAGRVSCARPHRSWLRAAALWREHARRTGRAHSVARALETAADAAACARDADEILMAAMATAQGLIVRFDLSGGLDSLSRAREALQIPTPGARSRTLAGLAAIATQVVLRQARVDEDVEAMVPALKAMDGAIRTLATRNNDAFVDDYRLERAAALLEIGVIWRDAISLSRAGTDLEALVHKASPDYRPLTRARALTLCGAGLAALGALGRDAAAQDQGHTLIAAATEQFTPDHSPLDWVAIQLARCETGADVPLKTLGLAETLTAGQDLILGAMVRDRLMQARTTLALSRRDRLSLRVLESDLRHRLASHAYPVSGLDWAVDQIAMARLVAARRSLKDIDTAPSAMALVEAAAIAREQGVPTLAACADRLIATLSVGV